MTGRRRQEGARVERGSWGMGFTVLLQTPRISCPGSVPVEPGTLCSLGIPLWQVTVSTAPSQAPLRPQTLPAPLCYLCPASPALTNMFLLGAQCCSSVPPGCIGREPLQWKAQNRVWVTLHRCGFMSRSCCGLSQPQVTCCTHWSHCTPRQARAGQAAVAGMCWWVVVAWDHPCPWWGGWQRPSWHRFCPRVLHSPSPGLLPLSPHLSLSLYEL